MHRPPKQLPPAPSQQQQPASVQLNDLTSHNTTTSSPVMQFPEPEFVTPSSSFNAAGTPSWSSSPVSSPNQTVEQQPYTPGATPPVQQHAPLLASPNAVYHSHPQNSHSNSPSPHPHQQHPITYLQPVYTTYPAQQYVQHMQTAQAVVQYQHSNNGSPVPSTAVPIVAAGMPLSPQVHYHHQQQHLPLHPQQQQAHWQFAQLHHQASNMTLTSSTHTLDGSTLSVPERASTPTKPQTYDTPQKVKLDTTQGHNEQATTLKPPNKKPEIPPYTGRLYENQRKLLHMLELLASAIVMALSAWDLKDFTTSLEATPNPQTRDMLEEVITTIRTRALLSVSVVSFLLALVFVATTRSVKRMRALLLTFLLQASLVIMFLSVSLSYTFIISIDYTLSPPLTGLVAADLYHAACQLNKIPGVVDGYWTRICVKGYFSLALSWVLFSLWMTSSFWVAKVRYQVHRHNKKEMAKLQG